jgi:tetratricopeptide (TPR) repeat protein
VLLAGVLVLLVALQGRAQEQPPELEAIFKRGLELYLWEKYAESIPVAEEYTAVAAAKFGVDHPLYAKGLWYLGAIYLALNRLSEAEPVLKRALAITETALGPDHTQVADVLGELAELYLKQGRVSDAEPLFQRAVLIVKNTLDLKEKSLGRDHIDVAVALHDLAELFRKHGQLAEAEPLYTRALDIEEKVVGSEHPATALILRNLAELYRAQGRHAEAEILSKRSVDIRERARPAAQPNVDSRDEDPANMLSQAMELYRAGKYAEAIPIAERYAQIILARYGKDGPEYGLALNNLGELYRVTNRLSEAEPLLRRALTIDEKALGPDHPNLAIRLNNLANLLQNTNRLAEAEPLYRRALMIFEKSAGVDDPSVGMVLTSLAQLLNATNRVAEAEPLFKRAAAINEKALRRGANPQGRGQLGVEINDLTKEEADKLGLQPGHGVRVVRIVEGGPAEVAGLLANDILLSLDGSLIKGAKETVEAIQAFEPGTQVLLGISRDGTKRTTVAVLGGLVRTTEVGSPHLMLDTGGHTALIKGLVFTPDGKQLVSAGDDKVIRVWDWQTGSTVRTIRGQVGPGLEGLIYAIALSPDGRWLAAGGWMAPGFGVRNNEVGDIKPSRAHARTAQKIPPGPFYGAKKL